MKIAELLGTSQDNTLYKEDDSLVSNIDGIGVELELENIVLFRDGTYLPTKYLKEMNKPDRFWKAVEDGSLREGTEFIFRGPLFAANITAALDEMETFLSIFKRNSKGVEVTDRCSVHVHLDVRDLNECYLNNLILVYLLFERVLFQHINPLRLKNNYCRPLSDSSFKYTIRDMMSQGSKSLPSLSHIVKRECDKYSALNVLPITRFGSVEFRHHHGTKDMKAIKNWINIILALKCISKEYSIDEVLYLYQQKDPTAFISQLFEGTVLEDKNYLKGLYDINNIISKGITDVNEILEMDKLSILTHQRTRSRIKTENTLFHKYMITNKLKLEDVSGKSSNYTLENIIQDLY